MGRWSEGRRLLKMTFIYSYIMVKQLVSHTKLWARYISRLYDVMKNTWIMTQLRHSVVVKNS